MNILKNIFFVLVLVSFSKAFDFDKRLEISYVNTSGNTNTSSLNGKISANKKFENDAEVKLKASILKSEDNNKKSANKYDAELDYDHMLGDRLYLYLGSYYVVDKFSDYDSRLNIGPGLGYKLIYTKEEVLDFQGGFDYAIDTYEDGSKDRYAAPKIELNYKKKLKENLEFNQMFSYLGSTKDSKKYFLTSQTGLNVVMVENLSLGASYVLDYVNYTNKDRLDRKFLTSLIFDF